MRASISNTMRVEPSRLKAVVLVRRSHRGVFTVESLSDYSARLIGTLPLACGETVKMMFEIAEQPVDVAGQVVHVDTIDEQHRQVVVRFDAQSHVARRAIARLIARMADEAS
jgi:hypothetical protein